MITLVFLLHLLFPQLHAQPWREANLVMAPMGGGGGGGTTWDPSNADGNTLSGGNLTATGGAINDPVRSSTSKAASFGKVYWRVKIVTVGGGSKQGFGFVDGTFSVTGGNPIGVDTHSVACFNTVGIYYNNAGVAGSCVASFSDWVANAEWEIAADIGATSVAWCSRIVGEASWQGSASPCDPVAGTNQTVTSITGPIYIAGLNNSGDAMTIETNTGTPPSGYVKWN
jgi:hypothetical protein